MPTASVNLDSLRKSQPDFKFYQPGFPIKSTHQKLITTQTAPATIIPEFKKNTLVPSWQITTYMVILILFSWIKISNVRIFKTLKNAYFNLNFMELTIRDERAAKNRHFNLLSILSLFIIGFISSLYLQSKSITISQSGYFTDFILIAFFINLFFWLKQLMVYISGYLMDNKELIVQYLFFEKITFIYTGLLLLPLSLLISYTHILNQNLLFQMAFWILTALILIKIGRAFIIAITKVNLSVFHIFLYICALEILPLMVIFKNLTDYK